ncbi:vomeronasal type-1 receptor 4-like [Acomys russatus]|uniref:vomeronasal type-1 receptor 4-like n=1 Tax=Acomys russatus TaxID=60746 RepID=UPI0021E2C620|nr:vomeronasal type-1 receptor 4-like [Acomys russatus]
MSTLITTTVSTEALSISSQNKALKTTEEVALQIFLLCQVGLGTVANILLFVHNFSPILTGSGRRPTQVVLTHVAVANALILLLTAFPNNMVLFTRRPRNDFSCKYEYYARVVARSSNLCSTSVLSTYQFVTLVPGNWGRVMLRRRTPEVLSYSCYSCWFFSILNNIYIPMKLAGPQSTRNDTDSNRKWVCTTSGLGVEVTFLRFAHDAVFIGIMVSTSVSMVILLHRHRQRLRHIHTFSDDQRAPPETRAAHTILMLVVMFVNFYVLDCICTFFHTSYITSRLWLSRINEILTAGFPTLSPLLLIYRHSKNPCSVIFPCCKPH